MTVPVVISDLFAEIEPVGRLDGTDDNSGFMARLSPIIDATIKRLAKTKFRPDPMSGERYSRMSSILGSAQKRHGHIIETAIRESLRNHNRYQLWDERQFLISPSADNLANTQSPEECCRSDLPYGARKRHIQNDLGLYDVADLAMRSYEIKRGNALHDSSKVRSIWRDLLAIQMLLKDYGRRKLGVSPITATAKIICYYGQRSVPAPWSLISR